MKIKFRKSKGQRWRELTICEYRHTLEPEQICKINDEIYYSNPCSTYLYLTHANKCKRVRQGNYIFRFMDGSDYFQFCGYVDSHKKNTLIVIPTSLITHMNKEGGNE
jgi:hypothetical protein